jgi:pyruvate dehydrogenase phosphatase
MKQVPITPTPEKNGYIPKRKELVKKAIQDAFVDLDRDILNGCFDEFMQNKNSSKFEDVVTSLKPAVAGSCALVTVVDGSDLYVACTGDSRAALGRKLKSGAYEAIPLSVDQTAKNPHEYERMIEEHPGEMETVIVKGRVLGGLMPTRAFGDARYKWPADFQAKVLGYLGRRGTPRNFHTPPYVTAKPEVTYVSLTDFPDSFLVMGTDGVYDETSSEDVVALTASKLNVKKVENSLEEKNDNFAMHLIRNSLAGPSGTTRTTDRLRRILNIPAGLSRRFRDDMTVNVIFFNNLKPPTTSAEDVPLIEMDKTKRKSRYELLDRIQARL